MGVLCIAGRIRHGTILTQDPSAIAIGPGAGLRVESTAVCKTGPARARRSVGRNGPVGARHFSARSRIRTCRAHPRARCSTSCGVAAVARTCGACCREADNSVGARPEFTSFELALASKTPVTPGIPGLDKQTTSPETRRAHARSVLRAQVIDVTPAFGGFARVKVGVQRVQW